MLKGVRQAFLHEPVGGQVNAGRELNRLALDPQLDRQAGLARLLDQPLDLLQAGLRGERGRLLGPSQDADHAAHLGERLAPGLLDDEQGLALLFLLGAEEPPCRGRLDGHDADAVPDHVVQLARDPRALVRDR